MHNLPSSFPGSALEARERWKAQLEAHLSNSPARSASVLPVCHKLAPPDTSPGQDPLPSTLTYVPSERDIDNGRVVIRSFRIPNPCDEESMEDRNEGDEEGERIHPAKALFALLMHAYSVGRKGGG